MENDKAFGSLFTGRPRPETCPDTGMPTRIDIRWYSPAEIAIRNAVWAVEDAGASASLTEAVMLLSKAKDHVANHMEGK